MAVASGWLVPRPASARRWPTPAARGARLALSARSPDKLRALGIDSALILPCDATDVASLASARDVTRGLGARRSGGLSGRRLCADARRCIDLQRAEQVIEVNFSAAMRLASTVLHDLNPGGGIAFVASVAGYRGLPKALCYGPGKAALIHFAECLHLDLAPRGIGVWIINPGFVRTRLTAQNKFAMPVLLSPEQAAQAVVAGFRTGRFEIHFPKRHVLPQAVGVVTVRLVLRNHSP